MDVKENLDPVRRRLVELVEARDLDMAKVSKAIGRNHAYLHHFIKYKKPKTLTEIDRHKLAEVLQCDEAELRSAELRQLPASGAALSEEQPPFRSNVSAILPAPDIAGWPRDLPVYGTAIGGSEEFGAFDFNMGDIVDYIRRPLRLQGVKNAFAVFAVGESMVPRIRPGGPCIVHPGIAPAPGDDVLVELKPRADGEAHPGLIKRLVSRNENRLRLAQYNPPDENIVIQMKRVLRLYRIVPYEDLLAF